MSWVVPGLLYAFFNSVVIFVNEKFKMQPSFLGMYRGFGSMAVALPFFFGWLLRRMFGFGCLRACRELWLAFLITACLRLPRGMVRVEPL